MLNDAAPPQAAYEKALGQAITTEIRPAADFPSLFYYAEVVGGYEAAKPQAAPSPPAGTPARNITPPSHPAATPRPPRRGWPKADSQQRGVQLLGGSALGIRAAAVFGKAGLPPAVLGQAGRATLLLRYATSG